MTSLPSAPPGRLPAGRHGLSPDLVVANQRERIFYGVVRACNEAGYRAMTVREITAHAQLSRRTFYDLFANKEEAFLAACDDGMQRLAGAVAAASANAANFAETAVSGLTVLFDLAAQEQPLARMVLVEAMAAGPEAVSRRNAGMEALAAVINFNARQHLASPPPDLTAELVVGGIWEMLYRRVMSGEVEELHFLLPDLVFSSLLPYIGLDEARAIRRQTQARLPRRATR